MTLETWIAFALMNLAYSVSPGPNAAVIVAATARDGVRAGVGALVGILLAEILWAGFAVLIVTGVLDLDGLAPGLLETAGAGVLLVLGGLMLWPRAPGTGAGPETQDPRGRAGGRVRAPLGKAVCVGLTNPVAMIFFVSVAPLFLSGSPVTPAAALAFVLAALVSCAVAHAPYIGVARIGGNGPGRWIERGCGVLLCAMGAQGLLTAMT